MPQSMKLGGGVQTAGCGVKAGAEALSARCSMFSRPKMTSLSVVNRILVRPMRTAALITLA